MQQLDLDLQRGPVVGRQDVWPAVGAAAGAGAPAERCELNESVDRRPPQLVLRRSARHLGAEHAIAEILDQQQAVLEILGQNLRRAQARRPQRPGDGRERAHHVLGQMRDAAVGLAVADRRAVRLARRIHQQGRAAVAAESRA